MKKRIVYLFALSLLVSCNIGANNKSNEQEAENNDTCQLKVTQEEKDETYPIGDRAFFDVKGNVKSILDVATNNLIEFDTNGLYFSAEYDEVETKDGITTRRATEADGAVEFWAIYDAKGRLIEESESVENMGVFAVEYDKQNRVVKYKDSQHDALVLVTFKYNKEGDCIQKTEKIKEHYFVVDIDVPKEEKPTITKYTILTKDKQGNWLKRKDSKGETEERVIKYY